jgi:replicative DNA helicase
MAKNRFNFEVLDTIPPQSLEAERAVIGSIILDANYCDDVSTIIKPEDFYADANQILFREVLAVYRDYRVVDVLLLMDRLTEMSLMGAIGGEEYLYKIAHSVPWAANAVHYAKIIKEHSSKRSCIHAAKDLLSLAYDDSLTAEDWRQAADKTLIEQTDEVVVRTKNALESVAEFSDAIDAAASGRATVPWGFPEIDQSVGFMTAGELIIIAARPSFGKSAFAMNIVEHNARAGRNVLVFSLEMPAKDLVSRSICGEMGVDGLRLRNGLLDAKERSLLAEGMARFSRLPIYICDNPRMTVEDLRRESFRTKRKHGIEMVVIDYLGLVEGSGGKDMRLYEQTTKVTHGIKQIARELGVPLLCLCQLNRSGDDRVRPTLRELRDSGAIEQDADRVAFVVRASLEENAGKRRYVGIDDKNDASAMILFDKNRNCPTANIRLKWNPRAIRFESLYDQSTFLDR